jgi:hypothetical protein
LRNARWAGPVQATVKPASFTTGNEAKRLVFAERDGGACLESHDRFLDVSEQALASHDVEGFLKRFQVRRAHHHRGRTAALGDDDPGMLSFHRVHNLGQPVFRLGQRQLLSDRRDYRYSVNWMSA